MENQTHPFVKVTKSKNKKGLEVHNPPTNQGSSMNPNAIVQEDINIKRITTIKNVVESTNMAKAAAAGFHRGGVKHGSKGRPVSIIQMYNKAKRQVSKGLEVLAKGQKQAASLDIAKEKQDQSAEKVRTKANQYRIN